MKKEPVPQLIFWGPVTWRIAEKERPKRTTRYASKYGVPVLGFDMKEYKDSGSCIPFVVDYSFEKKEFFSLHAGSHTILWLPVPVTHWTTLPPIPVYGIENVKIKKSPSGFSYFAGTEELAKEFVELGNTKRD